MVKLYDKPTLLVYDYAVGGAMIHGVKRQIEEDFSSDGGVGSKPDWVNWDGQDTLFGTIILICWEA